jgi:hypothetical protein
VGSAVGLSQPHDARRRPPHDQPTQAGRTVNELSWVERTVCDEPSRTSRRAVRHDHRRSSRRGNRRYYQRHDVLMIRQIRSLLYDQGFTITGARARLEGQQARMEVSISSQIVRQVRMELEEVLQILRR